MPATTPGSRAHEELPESQRVTIPSPQPFPRIAAGMRAVASGKGTIPNRSPGAYRLVDGEPQEDPQSRR
jgi:hypothetical protein